MDFRIAHMDDAKMIAENNMKLGFESEKKQIPYNISLAGVKAIIRDKNKGFYMIGEENNEFIGQLMITYEWSDWNNCNMWWIQSVYVSQKHRRKGVFKKLFNEIEKRAKENNVNYLRLYVHHENKKAINAYESVNMKTGKYLLYCYDI